MPASVARGQGQAILWIHAHVGYDGRDCLIWPFYRDKYRGYGTLGFEGRNLKAHRVMCELVNGRPPSPAHVPAHSCGNGHLGCVHPRHLSWKTRSGNQLDRRQHGTIPPKTWGFEGKLTDSQVMQIFALRGRHSTYEIGTMFGISFQTVGRIHRNGTNKKCRRAA